MKRLVLVLFAGVLVSICSSAVAAQSATRIHFSSGARSKVVTGSLNGYKSHQTFVIHVRKGQTLKTVNTGKNEITISIKAPPGSTYDQDMAADCHDKNEVSPTAAGDYKITVTECMKADAWKGTFTFKVSVR